MRTAIVVTLLALLPALARADEQLAKRFLEHVPGKLRDFDPVADALKAEGLKGKELKQQVARIKAGLGAHGKAGADGNRNNHNQPAGRARVQQTPTDKQMQRMARAARRRAMVAQMDAAALQAQAFAVMQANIMVARMTPHY